MYFKFIDESADEPYYKSIPFQYHVKEDKIIFSEAIKNQIGMKMCYEHFKDLPMFLLFLHIVFYFHSIKDYSVFQTIMLDAQEEIMWIHLEGNEFGIQNGKPVYLFVMTDITNYIERITVYFKPFI